MSPLTARQKQVLDIINSFVNKGEPFPTLQAIASRLGVRHKSGVIGHMKALEKKGYISRREKRVSDFMLRDQESSSRSGLFPLTGILPAGTPGQSFDQRDQNLAFDHAFFGGGNLQAVRISGDSMLGDSICDGDTAIIAMQSEWREQDIVAARIEDEVTLKRIQSCPDGKVALIPSNPDYPTRHYPAESVEVIGKFAGLVRKA